jgi:mono/diheme cytochrome c family protein
VLPTTACGTALPGSYTAICGGCHTSSGTPNSRYPDLFKFTGTAADMKTKVRMGGNGMAAYPPSLIADADIDAIYAYFKGHDAPDGGHDQPRLGRAALLEDGRGQPADHLQA